MKTIEITENLLAYEEYLFEEEKSENTIKKYVRDIKKFINYIEGETEISKSTIIKFKEFINREYKISSANSIFVALNKYLYYLGEENLKIKLIKNQKNIFAEEGRFLTKKEYIKLIETAKNTKKEKLALIMQTICSTGIRVSELRYITVESLKKGRIQVNLKGKNRIIFLTQKLVKKLEKYIKRRGIKKGIIFKTKNGKTIDRSNIWKAMKSLSKEAGIDENKIFPHNLRHLFAVSHYKKEKDIIRLADILGHSSIETTRIYTKITVSEYQKGISELNLVYG